MSSPILVVVSGGIAAYKSLDIISGLQKALLCEVNAMATKEALNFVTEASLANICDTLYMDDKNTPVHVHAAQHNKIIIVAPATANIIAKIAAGIADDLPTSTIVAVEYSVHKLFLFPAMNTNMWLNPITQRNVNTLKSFGWTIMEPGTGHLVCGAVGIGKLPSTKDVIAFIQEQLNKKR